MADKQKYECESCGKKAETAAGDPEPDCCGKTMTKAEALPFCQTSTTAEHSRLDDFEEPCDDGRSGN